MKYLFSFILVACALSASAEEHPMEVRFNLGKAAFVDESSPFDHTVFGTSVRFYLMHRLSIEPELVYMQGPGSDRDYFVFSSVAYDLVTTERAALYLIWGVGIMHHRRTFPGAVDPTFSHTAFAASGGVGARVFVAEHVFASADLRIGSELHTRITGGFGYRF